MFYGPGARLYHSFVEFIRKRTTVSVLLIGVVLFTGSPAFRAGLRAGQVLLSVSGSNALVLSHQEISQLIQKSQTPITHRLLMSTCIYPFNL